MTINLGVTDGPNLTYVINGQCLVDAKFTIHVFNIFLTYENEEKTLHRAPSSAKPTGEHGLLSFSNLSRGSNAKFQILLLRTPPCGVPQTGLIVLIMPRTSAIEFLFLRKFIYHLIIIGGYLLSTRTL